MKRINRIIQIVWMIVGAVALVEAFIEFQKNGVGTRVYILFGAFVVALVMYSLRRRQGRSMK